MANPRTTTPAPPNLSLRAWSTFAVLLSVLAGTAWYLFAEWSIAHRWGYSLDDSWIYAVYAKNLATGHGYSFNPGERVAAATGPLYVFILAGLYSLFHDVVIPAKIMGILCLAASGLLLMSAVRRLSVDKDLPPLIAGVLLALSPAVLWGALGGLEVPFCLLLVCAGLHFYVHERWVWGCLFWALSIWLRPEAILLALLGVAGAGTKLSRSQLALTVLGSAAIVGSYLLFNQAVGSWILPSSAKVAAHLGSHFFASQWTMMKQWADLWLPDNLARYRPKYLIIFPDWFQDFGAIDPVTDQVVFYDADSTFKYSPFLGVGLRHNTISSRNTMYLYERMGRNQTGASRPQLIVH